MRKLVLASLLMTTTLAGCATIGESRANPANWFGPNRQVVVQPGESEVNTLIPERRRSIFARSEAPPYAGELVEQVTELHLRRVPGGALVEVTGVLRSIEGYDVRLIPLEEADPATLSYELRAVQPRFGQGVGNSHARAVTAALRLTDQELAGVSALRVQAQANSLSARR